MRMKRRLKKILAIQTKI